MLEHVHPVDIEIVERLGPPPRGELVMAMEVEMLIATRLAAELAESVRNLNALPTVEAAANLRKTLLKRCAFYRRLVKDHPESKEEVFDRLKSDQMMLVLVRQFREAPDDRPSWERRWLN